jgi:hypothetical protein
MTDDNNLIEPMVAQPPVAVIPHHAQKIGQAAKELVQRAQAFEITDRHSFQTAAGFLRALKAKQHDLEEMRLSVTRPLIEAQRKVNEWFKDPIGLLERAESTVKRAMGTFERKERERIEQEERAAIARANAEQEELQRRSTAAAAKGNERRAAELAARAASVVPAAPELAPLKAKGISFGELWGYDVMDELLIPREYLMIDHAKIRAVVKAMKGATKIPGIAVRSSPQVSSRSE